MYSYLSSEFYSKRSEKCEHWSQLYVLTPSGAGSVSNHLALWITDLMTVVGEPKEFSSKKKWVKEGRTVCSNSLSLAFPSHSNLSQSGYSLHLITRSLTPVSHNHQVPFSVIASHFPASSNCNASLHLSSFLLYCIPFTRTLSEVVRECMLKDASRGDHIFI